MEEWKSRAIIIRLGHFRERDVWLRLILPERGLCTVFAFGGAVSRRRFCGCLDVLNELDCRIKAGAHGGYLALEEAALHSAPLRLRKDWQGMGALANCLCFAEAAGISVDNSREGYGLIRNLRDLYEEGPLRSWLIPHFFRLRLAAVNGYAPDFNACFRCGAKLSEKGLFLVDEGHCLCSDCAPAMSFMEKRRGLMLAEETLALLGAIQKGMPAEWPALACSDHTGRQALRAIDGFIQFHMGLAWDNGAFRRV